MMKITRVSCKLVRKWRENHAIFAFFTNDSMRNGWCPSVLDNLLRSDSGVEIGHVTNAFLPHEMSFIMSG